MSNKYKLIDGVRYLIADPTIENESPDVCFLVNGKHYRLEKGGIVYDHFKKKYVLKSSIQVENGFIGIDKDDKPILGNFSWPSNHLLEDNIIANYKGQEFICISDKIFENTAWEERLLDGEYYLKSDLPVKEFSKISKVSRDIKNSFPYNASEELKKATKLYEERFNVEEFNKGISAYPQVLGKYTYGIEFETTKGIIPKRICNRLGLIPLRDGSIDGIEYATIPLSGKKGIQAIIDSCKELEKRTTYNDDCSLHIHIGGMPRTEAYILALSKVLCHVQEEMYEMFPFYTRGGFNLKKKDYTAPLPATHLLGRIDAIKDVKDKKEIDANFQHIFEFLSMGHRYRDYDYSLKKVVSHPSDPGGTSKWYVKSRYRWVNMIPLLFGNKKTIEFRIHTPTYDYNKILYFAIICASLIDLAEKSNTGILTNTYTDYSLTEIVYRYLAQFGDKYATLHSYINKYIQTRKSCMVRDIKSGNFYGKEDNLKPLHTVYSKNLKPFSHFYDKSKSVYGMPENDINQAIERELRRFTAPPVATFTRERRTTQRGGWHAEMLDMAENATTNTI
jgi:hypothetical protein